MSYLKTNHHSPDPLVVEITGHLQNRSLGGDSSRPLRQMLLTQLSSFEENQDSEIHNSKQGPPTTTKQVTLLKQKLFLIPRVNQKAPLRIPRTATEKCKLKDQGSYPSSLARQCWLSCTVAPIFEIRMFTLVNHFKILL